MTEPNRLTDRFPIKPVDPTNPDSIFKVLIASKMKMEQGVLVQGVGPLSLWRRGTRESWLETNNSVKAHSHVDFDHKLVHFVPWLSSKGGYL